MGSTVGPHVPRGGRPRSQRRDDVPDDPQRVAVVVREVVGDAGDLGVQIAAAELLGGHHLTGRRLHQRRAAKEDGALVAHDDGLVAHRGHVSATRGAGSEHRGDLRDALRAEVGLVEEDAAEVFAVGEDLVLSRQEGAAGIDQVDARQPVLARNLLRAKVFLDRDRVVGATLHRRIVGDDHAFAARHPADACDHARAGAFVVVHAVGGQRRQLEEGTARIEQSVHPVARQQLASADVAFPGSLRSAERGGGQFGAQLRHQLQVLIAMRYPRRQGLNPFG